MELKLLGGILLLAAIFLTFSAWIRADKQAYTQAVSCTQQLPHDASKEIMVSIPEGEQFKSNATRVDGSVLKVCTWPEGTLEDAEPGKTYYSATIFVDYGGGVEKELAIYVRPGNLIEAFSDQPQLLEAQGKLIQAIAYFPERTGPRARFYLEHIVILPNVTITL